MGAILYLTCGSMAFSFDQNLKTIKSWLSVINAFAFIVDGVWTYGS